MNEVLPPTKISCYASEFESKSYLLQEAKMKNESETPTTRPSS
ncbi:hypothetical protein OKW21_006733 [Catalinimonas alkaloidigena]|nr:hypothetical protein [Catalinimonas alkaloidigena]